MRWWRKIVKKRGKIIYIFWEWETEICYFQQLKSNHNFENIKFEVPSKPEWQLSSKNIERLEEKRKRIYKIIKDWRTKFSKEDVKNTNSKIFYLLDIDWNKSESYSQKDIEFIKKNFEDENVKIIFSNRDIELWILLHFSIYKKEDWKYIEEIEKESLENYKKWKWFCNISFFRKIIQERLLFAIKHWKELEKYNIISKKRIKLKEMIPFTEIHTIFEGIEK